MSHSLIVANQLTKIYSLGNIITVEALRGVSLNIEKGEFVALMGPSGSGKSTLMNVLGCLDQPTSGDYYLDGILVSRMSKVELAYVRNRKLGFVFQGFQLLPRRTAIENVELPLIYSKTLHSSEIRQKALEALANVGLESRAYHTPHQLSGGQQQRVAIARALVNNPSLLLADEPTGNLDTKTSVEIMELFQALNKKGITIVLVTHEPDIASFAQRKIELRDGHIVSDTHTDSVLRQTYS